MPGRVNPALIIVFSILILLSSPIVVSFADSADDQLKKIEEELNKKEKQYESTSKKLSDIRSQAESVASQISKLSSQMNITQGQINELEANINDMEAQLDEIKKNLADRQSALSQKIDFRNRTIRNFAKRGVLNDLEIFLTSLPSNGLNGFQYSAYSYIFEKTLTSEAISVIGAINKEITQFESDKKEAEDLKTSLEKSQKDLIATKQQLNTQKFQQQDVLGNLNDQQENLEGQLSKLSKDINDLTAKQQSILNEKAGSGSSSVGNYEQATQKLPNPGFSPAFAASSYGAYTHGNGMSQYGAKGRATAGQSTDQILKFYYKSGTKKVSDFSKIGVQGYGTMDVQKYLYGIAEMPSDWPDAALRAQAIAARTYAYRSSKPICTTESCQVFLKSKSDNPPSKWKKAVDDTKNVVLDGASTAQYSSTTGGYINNVGWDDSGDWPGDAYEKKAGSPWFFKAWYTKSYSTSSSTCGRSSPWLNEKEMADILNAWVVLEKGKSSDTDHISPVTTSCWGGDPYSMDEMASKASSYGGKYTDVKFAGVTISNGGYTSKVKFDTNRGRVEIDGSEFKKVFNLRAPGYISIKNKLYDFVTD